jgi:hypothetical protein
VTDVTPEGWPQECQGHEVCNPKCPHSTILATIMCEVIPSCLLWNHKTQGCSYFLMVDEPSPEDCAAAHHLHSRALLVTRESEEL